MKIKIKIDIKGNVLFRITTRSKKDKTTTTTRRSFYICGSITGLNTPSRIKNQMRHVTKDVSVKVINNRMIIREERFF